MNEEIVKSANDELEEIPAPPPSEDTPPPSPLSGMLAIDRYLVRYIAFSSWDR